MSDDAMVPIAHILGRGEALTVAAMLDAAGIIVHLGGEHYTSVSPHVLAIGGFCLTVPAWQHQDASEVLAEMLAEPDPPPSSWIRRAIRRLGLAWAGTVAMISAPWVAMTGFTALIPVLLSPLFLLTVPVNPQGRGDYYLFTAQTD
ncbi:MAG: hypothetical protein ACT6Q5_03920 [Sphingopyxis solisilvae]|uniref:hypothetical protein n=1 Tax=Sphingopyxis solisilvae TaxID=1886788 RepID=UPI004035D434